MEKFTKKKFAAFGGGPANPPPPKWGSYVPILGGLNRTAVEGTIFFWINFSDFGKNISA